MSVLLGGDPAALKDWAARWEKSRVLGYVAVIIGGAGLYGAAMGWWRSPVQGGYNLIKFPLAILATTLGNALINGMLAPLLGLNLHFRQSIMVVLMSFTIAAAILGAFAPSGSDNGPAEGGPAGMTGGVEWESFITQVLGSWVFQEENK